jgi:hypothetical protein
MDRAKLTDAERAAECEVAKLVFERGVEMLVRSTYLEIDGHALRRTIKQAQLLAYEAVVIVLTPKDGGGAAESPAEHAPA